jgi:hypothetical protein
LSGLAPNWDARPQVDYATGVVHVEAYNVYLDAHPERAMDHLAVASAFVGDLDGRLESRDLPNDVVEIVHADLPDDSIYAERWELTLEARPDGSWRLGAVEWSQQCQPGRGHQDFSTELCV